MTREEYVERAIEILHFSPNIGDGGYMVDDPDDDTPDDSPDDGAWVRCWLWVANEYYDDE